MLHEDLKRFFSAFPKSGHPMAICAATVGALSTFYQDVRFNDPAERRWAAAIRLMVVKLLDESKLLLNCTRMYHSTVVQMCLFL